MQAATAQVQPSFPGPVALVHDWLTGMRGGERVLEVLAETFPGAHLFTLFHLPGTVSPQLEALPRTTSFVQRLPFLAGAYRYYLPLFPRAISPLDLSAYPLVVSSSHCVAKGVQVAPGAIHVSYCHTPMRYAWDRFDDYFGPASGSRIPRRLARGVVKRLKRWDRESSRQVTHFLANSQHVAQRIRDCYDRSAEVIPPPVDTARFRPEPGSSTNGYLMVSALVPYKRVDRAIEAFRGTGRRLRIVGDGPERQRLTRLAGPEVTFLGRLPESALVAEYQGCRALLMPGVEDAGIAPLEAMACGKPVIALDEGGAPEVIEPPGSSNPSTGLLFDEPTPECLREALARFEAIPEAFDPASIRHHALGFDRAAFRSRIETAVRNAAAERP